MHRATATVTLLAIGLVVSNLFWAYRALDFGISYTYQGVSLEENQQALAQALAIVKVLGNCDASRQQVIQAAQNAWPSSHPFEKDGLLQVGRLGLRFSENGRLVEAIYGD
ncbi:hypothetical protein [Methylomonas koyamae]|nr:hypothetical protein [Methylomonas koyamae]ATG91609.1 hypothetical protein MKLM6_3422 [Methylomonas koyamae]